MPNKNKQRNAFYFFMKEQQAEYAKAGQNIPMKKMPDLAHPKWKELSLAEKEKYEKMAKGHKLEFQVTGRMASDGTLIAENEREEEEKELREKRMRQEIIDMVMIPGATKEQFAEINSRKKYCFLTFNVLCYVNCVDAYNTHKTLSLYIPNEVGIVEYCIKDGILGKYHAFIHPGPMPKGYSGEAKRHSEDTHQIPMSGHPDSERDYLKVWKELMSFINPPSSRSGESVPVLCLKDDMSQTIGCLQFLAREADTEEEFEDLKVYDASYLLFELRKGVDSEAASYAIAEQYLKKNSFDYVPDTRCLFHEELDSAYCALGYAQRLSYLLSDAICNLFRIKPTENHLPRRSYADKAYEVHLPSSRNHPSNERGIGRGFPRGGNNVSSGIESMSLYDRVHSGDSERTDSRLHERIEPNRYTGTISKSSRSETKFSSESDSENSPPSSPVSNVYDQRPPTSVSSKNSTVELRQPSSMSYALSLALSAKGAPAVVPGKGIGRGQRMPK